ncbi:MAG: hypothetical protein GXY14_11035 [Spirochaetes bacterium]|nr:hypothetical protein [Spirochaetota bacterium]
MILKILLWINISLLYVHELDAVRRREWRMMIFSDRVSDETAYIIFTALHVPLFFIIFLMVETQFNLIYWSVSIFGLFHFFIHYIFRKHSENRMLNVFSRTIILLILLVSITGIILALIMPCPG